MRWATIAAAGLGLTLASHAHAGLEVCNQTDGAQSIAIGYKGENDWTSEGWWNVEPGDCATLVGGDLTKRYYYYHAVSRAGQFRGQDYIFCTQGQAFLIEGDTDCTKRGFEETDFREIDTGETAKSFTLTLVANSSSGSDAGAASGKPSGEGNTQSVNVVPDEPDVAVSQTNLQSDLPAGRHGEAFDTSALFQGCEIEDGREICAFHAGGIKLKTFYRGPTPDDMLYALESMALNTPVKLAGDMVEARGLQQAVVLRSVRAQPGADKHAIPRRQMQGRWLSRSDSKSEINIRGSEIYVRYEGSYRSSRYMQLADRCDGLRGAGPVLIQTSLRDREPTCYRIKTLNATAMELEPVKGGSAIRFLRN